MLAALAACRDDAPVKSSSVDASSTVESSIVDASVGAEDDVVDAEPDVREMVEQAMVLLEQSSDIAKAELANCDTLGEKLEAYRQQHDAAIKQVDVLYETRFDTEFKRLQPQYRARYKAAWAKLTPALNKCKSTPRVKRVLLEIWGDDVDASMGPISPPKN